VSCPLLPPHLLLHPELWSLEEAAKLATVLDLQTTSQLVSYCSLAMVPGTRRVSSFHPGTLALEVAAQHGWHHQAALLMQIALQRRQNPQYPLTLESPQTCAQSQH